jgi:hypothetical protein
LEVMLLVVEVMLQSLGKHEVLVEKLLHAPKSKPASTCSSQVHGTGPYVKQRVCVYGKATIKDRKLEEVLRCALL